MATADETRNDSDPECKKTSSILNTLPPELREMIWKLVLADEDLILVSDEKKRRHLRNHQKPTRPAMQLLYDNFFSAAGLLWACREVRMEALSWIFQSRFIHAKVKDFNFQYIVFLLNKQPKALVDKLVTETRSRQLIITIHLEVTPDCKEYPELLYRWIHRVRNQDDPNVVTRKGADIDFVYQLARQVSKPELRKVFTRLRSILDTQTTFTPRPHEKGLRAIRSLITALSNPSRMGGMYRY